MRLRPVAVGMDIEDALDYILVRVSSITTPRAAMSARSNNPQPLGELLEDVIERLGVQEKVDEARVVDAWDAVAGDQVRKVTESAWMKGGTLYVKIASAAWRQELHMNRRAWRQRINDELGKEVVEKMVFR